MAFLGAKSYYLMAPVFSKDQKTLKLQLINCRIINTYPDSKLINNANELIFELDYRLEFKEYSIALQYNVLTD